VKVLGAGTPSWTLGVVLALVCTVGVSCTEKSQRQQPTAEEGLTGRTSSASTELDERLTPEPGPFHVEVFGERLRDGAPGDVRAELATGQDSFGAVHDSGPVFNGGGQGLVLTSRYGAYRDESEPCPAPWEGLIRWGSAGRTHVWTAKAAPQEAAPTSVGFVIPATSCLSRRNLSPNDATDWYVDSHGRIGELRAIAGDPPAGTRADAVLTTGYDQSVVYSRAAVLNGPCSQSVTATRCGLWTGPVPSHGPRPPRNARTCRPKAFLVPLSLLRTSRAVAGLLPTR